MKLASIPAGVTLLTHVGCGVCQDSQLPGCRDATPVPGHGVFLPQVQDLALISVELQKILVGLFFQLISQTVPLARRRALQHINRFSWVGVTCKLAQDALCLFDQVGAEDVK